MNYSLVVAGGKAGRRAKAHVTLGRYEDGRLCEIFVTAARTGSDMRRCYEAWSMSASRALQAGQGVKDLARGVRGMTDDYGGIASSPEEIEGRKVGSLWDAIGLLLEVEG